MLNAFPFDRHAVGVWAIENNAGTDEIALIMTANGYDWSSFAGLTKYGAGVAFDGDLKRQGPLNPACPIPVPGEWRGGRDAAGGNAPAIIKRKKVIAGGGHHGGAWKVAYADFVTAMMAFFLLMWLLNATTEQQLKGLADYSRLPCRSAGHRRSDGMFAATA